MRYVINLGMLKIAPVLSHEVQEDTLFLTVRYIRDFIEIVQRIYPTDERILTNRSTIERFYVLGMDSVLENLESNFEKPFQVLKHILGACSILVLPCCDRHITEKKARATTSESLSSCKLKRTALPSRLNSCLDRLQRLKETTMSQSE